jgi:hypothetical protein
MRAAPLEREPSDVQGTHDSLFRQAICYDAVRRHARECRDEQGALTAGAYVTLQAKLEEGPNHGAGPIDVWKTSSAASFPK